MIAASFMYFIFGAFMLWLSHLAICKFTKNEEHSTMLYLGCMLFQFISFSLTYWMTYFGFIGK